MLRVQVLLMALFFRIVSSPWFDTNLSRSLSSYIGNLLPPSDSLCPSWSSVPSYLSFGASCAYCLIQLDITVFNFRIISHSWIDVKLTEFASFLIVNLLPSSDFLFPSWSSLPSYHSFSASGVYCLSMLEATVVTFPHRFPSTERCHTHWILIFPYWESPVTLRFPLLQLASSAQLSLIWCQLRLLPGPAGC